MPMIDVYSPTARVQRLANRLVYGVRATPYEVLSEFSTRMAGAYESEDLLPRMARILGEGTGARNAVVWLKVGAELRPEAAWPMDDLPTEALALTGDGLPDPSGIASLQVEPGHPRSTRSVVRGGSEVYRRSEGGGCP